MSYARYVLAGYAVTFVGLVSYVAWVVTRTRALARSLPPAEDSRGPSTR